MPGTWVLPEMVGHAAEALAASWPHLFRDGLEQEVARVVLDAAFPRAQESTLTCDGCCSGVPATTLAVISRTNADRSLAPGYVFRLMCDGCAGKTREIAGQAGRAVTFIALGAEVKDAAS